MISAQILQNVVDGLKELLRLDFSVIETEGRIVASTESSLIGEVIDSLRPFMVSAAEVQIIEGYIYFKAFDNGVAEYVVSIKGTDIESHKAGQIAAFQVECLLTAYKERYDKDNFIKNLLLDNLLLVDIYSRAKKMGISSTATRSIFLIEVEDASLTLIDKLRKFYENPKDFITNVDEHHIIVVKQVKENSSLQELEEIASTLADIMHTELEINSRVSIGTKISDLKNVSLSYKEAKMALEVSSIFNPESQIVNYENLGIGRLIYQLPLSLCKIFMFEILGETSLDVFEEEVLVTVDKFFENNLNVSETSRQLFIHRNTLVYRLNKLIKKTGLDLTNFDDAVVFKILTMVSKYITYKEEGYKY
ncbi:MAG: helix-turn-helix domain-containing protein [Defluviitaleaceae bacterium]|nr:helix-turn-helix domain-containing protein [Defluviitaleaceae bacterium]